MQKRLKIIIIGFGSIGRRHLHNISTIMKRRGIEYSIDLLRSGKGNTIDETSAKMVDKIYYYGDTIPVNYDIAFITNPTFMHFETIKYFLDKANHMFIEKPVFNQSNLPIETLILNKNSIYYVACPLRYSNVIQYLKKNIDISKVYCARAISSSFLPEWRAGADYRNTYSAHREQGGGVSIDLIHEWDYLVSLFGLPEQVYNIKGKFSDLEIDSDDLSVYIAKYPHMAVELHLDYFGKKSIREIQLFMQDDTLVGDLINCEIRFLRSNKSINLKECRNDFQLREIEHFFDIVFGLVPNDNDISLALTVLKLAEGEI